MSEKSSKYLLKAKTSEFLSNKHNAEALQTIINSFKDLKHANATITGHLLSLEAIFIDLLKHGNMKTTVVPLQSREKSPADDYAQWLRDCFTEVFDLIVECIGGDRQSEAHQALNSAMKLLTTEGQLPLDDHLNQQPFPILKLNKIISQLLLTEKIMKNTIVRLSEYIYFEDFCYYTWKLVMKNMIPKDVNAIFIQNFLELLNVLIPTSSKNDDTEPDRFLCKQVKLDPPSLHRNVNKVWNFIVQWPHEEITQRQLLVLLLEKVLPHLDKPTMLTDYLMDSLDVGGQVSLLALQGIFVLIHKYNMSYPNIYEKLYGMFEPEIFHMKFKPRLFHLADIFLTSSYLPEALVAAFIKRLARLALIAPPQDVIITLYFIGNLIIRHPGLKRLICDQNSSEAREIAQDPYIMDEADPNKAQALSSSLWEIQLLRNHMLPNVAQAAKNIMTQPLPGHEWDLGQYLEIKENDLFDQEVSRKCRDTVALTFNRPSDLKSQQPQSAISKYWKL